MKKILLVTSALTGSGHKSISDALAEQFSGMDDLDVLVIEGFELGGRIGMRIGRLYGTTTRHAPFLYNAIWQYTMNHPIKFRMEALLYDRRFMEVVRSYQPDLILTVHSMFNTVLTRMLKKHGLDIPVMVLQADIINIHSSWCNSQANMTICPTQEAYNASIRQGMNPDRLLVLGFPVRKRFCDAAQQPDAKGESPTAQARCLMMSGGEGSGRLRAYAEALLKNTDVKLTIVCGRNTRLRRTLKKKLSAKYGERVNVLGFVSDMEHLMLQNDVIVARSSPNTLFESVTMTLPVIMIGPLPKQETDNPRIMQEHDLGIVCNSPAEAPLLLRQLLCDHGDRLRKIRRAQRSYRNMDAARDIAAFVAEQAKSETYLP